MAWGWHQYNKKSGRLIYRFKSWWIKFIEWTYNNQEAIGAEWETFMVCLVFEIIDGMVFHSVAYSIPFNFFIP